MNLRTAALSQSGRACGRARLAPAARLAALALAALMVVAYLPSAAAAEAPEPAAALDLSSAPRIKIPAPGTNLKDLPGADALKPAGPVTAADISLVAAVVEAGSADGSLLRFANGAYRDNLRSGGGETFVFGGCCLGSADGGGWAQWVGGWVGGAGQAACTLSPTSAASGRAGGRAGGFKSHIGRSHLHLLPPLSVHARPHAGCQSTPPACLPSHLH